MSENTNQYVVYLGSARKIVGGFSSRKEAKEWAERNITWSYDISRLLCAEEYEEENKPFRSPMYPRKIS